MKQTRRWKIKLPRPLWYLRNLMAGAAWTMILGTAAVSQAREWVSTDGRKLEAEFVSATDTEVTVKRASDLKIFKIPLENLSEADRKWIAENKDKPRPTRLGLEPEPAGDKENPYAKMLTGKWELAEIRGLPYALYGAKDLDPAKTYPLVIGLHGKSDNNENGKQSGIIESFTNKALYEKHPAILVAPLCYQPFGGTGGGWGDKPGKQTVDLIKDISKKLALVDKSRVYLFGHSMGGGGTVTLITDEPKLFAAGIVIAGWAPASAASVFKKVPVWAFHGSADDVVKPDSIQQLADALKRSKEFKYTEFPGKGHDIVGDVFKDPAVFEWLFAQKK